MRFNKKLAISLVSVAALSALVLAGCGNHHSSSAHQGATTTETEPHEHKAHKTHELHKSHDSRKAHKSRERRYHLAASHKRNKSADHQAGSVKPSRHKIAKAHRSENDDANSPVVNLGNGIVGQVDRGAGQIYVRFHMGRWTVTTHGNDVDESANTAVNRARYLSNYFQSHQMPVPNSQGTLNYDTKAKSATASWNTNNGTKSVSGNIHHVLNRTAK